MKVCLCAYVCVCVRERVYMCVGWRLTKENIFPFLDTLMTKNSPDQKLEDLAILCSYYEIKWYQFSYEDEGICILSNLYRYCLLSESSCGTTLLL